MIYLACRKMVTGLLLMTMALLALGCASDGSYSGTASVGVYGGYYGGYPGYYGGNVVVGAPMPPPGGMPPPTGGVHPPGGAPPPSVRPPAPPHVSQMPSRPMPAPAPRPMPAARGGGGGGRR
jgi:hypothetical protein